MSGSSQNGPAGAPEAEFLKHNWHDAQTQGQEEITRLAIEGMGMPTVQKIMGELMAQGLHPTVRGSDTLGLTIRLTGDDAKHLKLLRALTPK